MRRQPVLRLRARQGRCRRASPSQDGLPPSPRRRWGEGRGEGPLRLARRLGGEPQRPHPDPLPQAGEGTRPITLDLPHSGTFSTQAERSLSESGWAEKAETQGRRSSAIRDGTAPVAQHGEGFSRSPMRQLPHRGTFSTGPERSLSESGEAESGAARRSRSSEIQVPAAHVAQHGE